MSFFKSLKGIGAVAMPRTVPTAGGRKTLGGYLGARQAPQATAAPEAVAPQKPTDIWAKFRKK